MKGSSFYEQQKFADELPTPTPRARKSDPVTSHEAAASIEGPALTKAQKLIWDLIERMGPLTDNGIEQCYKALVERGFADEVSPSGLRTRRKELVDAGVIEDSGQTVRLPSGRKSILWITTKR